MMSLVVMTLGGRYCLSRKGGLRGGGLREGGWVHSVGENNWCLGLEVKSRQLKLGGSELLIKYTLMSGCGCNLGHIYEG